MAKVFHWSANASCSKCLGGVEIDSQTKRQCFGTFPGCRIRELTEWTRSAATLTATSARLDRFPRRDLLTLSVFSRVACCYSWQLSDGNSPRLWRCLKGFVRGLGRSCLFSSSNCRCCLRPGSIFWKANVVFLQPRIDVRALYYIFAVYFLCDGKAPCPFELLCSLWKCIFWRSPILGKFWCSGEKRNRQQPWRPHYKEQVAKWKIFTNFSD